MAFLDNIKISVKIIGVVLLLAVVSMSLIVFSGITLNRLDNEYSQLLEGDAQTRVELARVTRRAVRRRGRHLRLRAGFAQQLSARLGDGVEHALFHGLLRCAWITVAMDVPAFCSARC